MQAEMKLRKSNLTDDPLYKTTVAQKEVSRSIISMLPQIGKKSHQATDEDLLKLVKKYVAQEKERAIYELGHLKEEDVAGKNPSDVKKLVSSKIAELGNSLITEHIKLASFYLPEMVSVEEISNWIADNIDFSQFKNKMQAMKPIMEHFKGAADGKVVKEILLKM